MQGRCNSIANTLELPLSCTNPFIYIYIYTYIYCSVFSMKDNSWMIFMFYCQSVTQSSILHHVCPPQIHGKSEHAAVRVGAREQTYLYCPQQCVMSGHVYMSGHMVSYKGTVFHHVTFWLAMCHIQTEPDLPTINSLYVNGAHFHSYIYTYMKAKIGNQLTCRCPGT